MRMPIRVYLVGAGYDPKTKQVREEGLECIYGMGAKNKPGDGKDYHGTCMASKIGGRAYGVFKGAPVFTIVKITNSLASLLDALGRILDDIEIKKNLGRRSSCGKYKLTMAPRTGRNGNRRDDDDRFQCYLRQQSHDSNNCNSFSFPWMQVVTPGRGALLDP